VQPPRRGANETILLVEDDRAVRRSVRAMLESYGYRVIEAESPAAASALWRTAANSIDLLLTDLIMPGPLTGLQLAEDLVGNQPSLKVIFMTGYGADMATKLLRVPGRIVLQKPFSADALAACVRNALDEAV
jgi:DNA-binding NtrC family response regulator